ncbi:MAG: hypothetical protein L6R35_002333 [Caloplaca aegaea]|nr:MAG: hypothetical protein L6R35_002333 [Caloplaca aegaea]
MPPVMKKRKTGGASLSKTTATAPSTQRGIRTFGNISKPQPRKQPAGKTDLQANEKASSTTHLPIQPNTSTLSNKRKVQHIDHDPEIQRDPDHQAGLHNVEHHNEGPSRPECKPSPRRGRPPKTPRKKALPTSIPFETPTKGARSYLELLHLSSSPSSRQASSPPTSRADTPASSPPPAKRADEENESDPGLPVEIQDLLNLHSSFLTALSLHYAHHGSLAPVDFRNLRPNIERSWRKRRVSIRDVQQIISLQRQSSSTEPKLSLSDYGPSKTCIEIQTSSKDLGTHRRPLNEEICNKTFQYNLLIRWGRHAGSADNFVRSLPLAPITPCTSTIALAPLLAKGQRRLEDLKAGAIRAQTRSQPSSKLTVDDDHSANASDGENIPPTSRDPTNKPSSNSLAARKTSLFDRIKAKQEARLLSAALRAPLTPAQLQRKSALRRIEEIVPVLELLCSGAPVKTFTMPTVVQNLQMSLRNPIEKEEAVKAVRLLAEEVAPWWVGVREVGKVVGVTVRREGMVGGRGGVMRKVRELEEGL